MSYRRSADAWLSSSFLIAAISLCLLVALAVPSLGLKRIVGFVPANQASSTPTLDTNGGVLPTDSEIELKLRRADEYVAQKRFDLASVIWQNVLDMSSTALRSADGRQFTSVQYHVEQQLYSVARIHPEGLDAYRTKADGSALGLLAAAKGDAEEEKLAEIVRRYFFSSQGDEAAYTLGCLMLDRFEFISAGRLFSKMVDQHPDYMPGAGSRAFAPRGEVLLRLAISHARSGDTKAAVATIARIEQEASLDVTPGMLALVRRELEAHNADGHDPALVREGSWPMAHGTPARDGFMTGLPEDTEYKGVWRDQWHFTFPGAATQLEKKNEQSHRQRESVRYKWVGRDGGGGDWTPSGHMLLHDGYAYYKGYKQLICVDAETGKLKWRSRETEPYVRPLNGTTKEEILLFGDRTRTEIAIDRGVIYYYEDDSSQTISSSSMQFSANTSPALMAYPGMYGNKLVALDARTGKLLWDFATDKDAEGNTKNLRFTAAPTPAGGLLIVPAFDGTSHWMYALRSSSDEHSKRIVWRTLLCDNPAGGVSPWQTVGVAIEGGDVYVCNGTGWVFNLDAASGHVRWAVPYTRSVSNTNTRYNRTLATPLGFDVNTVVPVGRHLIVMAADVADLKDNVDRSNNFGIFSLDRRTGQRLWFVERNDATHFLGVQDDALFVAGNDFVVKYSISARQGFKLGSALDLGRITGRGFVANDGIYLPTFGFSASILKLDIDTLKPIERVGVRLPVNDEQDQFAYYDPIGNIITDGSRIYGLGMERAYALRHGTTSNFKRPVHVTPTPAVKVDGDNNVATGASDGETLRLHGIAETVESLSDYFVSLHPSEEQRNHFKALITQLGDASFDKRVAAENALASLPVVPVEMLQEVVTENRDAEVASRAKRILIQTAGQRERVLNAALRVIAEKKIKGLGKQTLDAVALCTEQYMLVSAKAAVIATAGKEDVPAIREALKDSSVDKRIVAAAAIGAVLEREAVDDLAALFKDDDAKVQLAAARALADMGHRGSLDQFVALMGHDDVYVRSDAASSLRALTGQRFSFIAYEKDESRAAALQKWKEWIATDGKTAKLTFPLSKSRFMLGRTLIANYTTNRVYEIDNRTDKETWSATVSRPWVCYGTPQGHRIVTSYSSRSLYEYDARGKEVWQVPNIPSYPQGIERLENGNTLVACSSSNRVIEVRPDKTFAWDKTFNRRPTSASRLENGNTLVTLQSTGQVVEVDRDAKTVWELPGLSSPISATRLPNGNTLVCEISGRRVREFDRDKKVVWDSTQVGITLQSPICAQRLENGHTLISDYKGLYEFDSKGKVIWKKLETGIRGFHRY